MRQQNRRDKNETGEKYYGDDSEDDCKGDEDDCENEDGEYEEDMSEDEGEENDCEEDERDEGEEEENDCAIDWVLGFATKKRTTISERDCC